MYSENSKSHTFTFFKQIYNILVIFRLKSVFETTALLKFPIYTTFARSYMVFVEAFIAET